MPDLKPFRRRPTTALAYKFRGAVDGIVRHNPHVPKGFLVAGKQGFVEVNKGDWIIQEPDGSGYYPCNPDIFKATYEAAP